MSITVVRKGLREKVIFEQRPAEVREAPGYLSKVQEGKSTLSRGTGRAQSWRQESVWFELTSV